RRPAPGDGALASIAAEHVPPDLRRNVLRGAQVGTDALRIAVRALDVGAIERELHAGTLAPAVAARGAQRRHDLEFRAGRLLGSVAGGDPRRTKRGEECIVVELRAALAGQDLRRLP